LVRLTMLLKLLNRANPIDRTSRERIVVRQSNMYCEVYPVSQARCVISVLLESNSADRLLKSRFR
jgi:hypothetical protein